MLKFEMVFKQKSQNGIEYNQKFKSLSNSTSFNNYFDFLKLFFSSNPDMFTPEFSSPLYDVIIEFAEKCDNFLIGDHSDFLNNNATVLNESASESNEFKIDQEKTPELKAQDDEINETTGQFADLRKKILKYIYTKFSTFLKTSFEQNDNFENLKILRNKGTLEQPELVVCDFEIFENKILNLMFLLAECIDINNKTLYETFPQIPKICIDQKFPDFVCIENIINCLSNQV